MRWVLDMVLLKEDLMIKDQKGVNMIAIIPGSGAVVDVIVGGGQCSWHEAGGWSGDADVIVRHCSGHGGQGSRGWRIGGGCGGCSSSWSPSIVPAIDTSEEKYFSLKYFSSRHLVLLHESGLWREARLVWDGLKKSLSGQRSYEYQPWR